MKQDDFAPMHRIVQIAVTSGGADNTFDVLYALCSDGSLWKIDRPNASSKPREWDRLPELP